MPLEGEANFKGLKKAYAKGIELRGKTLGIIGFGRIGQEVAKIALGIGMKVIATDKFLDKVTIEISISTGKSIKAEIIIQPFDKLITNSDFISLHVPAQEDYVIDSNVISQMKKGAGIINAARGGVIDEVALIKALDDGHLSFAGLDTFENEPKPEVKLLMHEKISLTPHIGAATNEAQDRIGIELAEKINDKIKCKFYIAGGKNDIDLINKFKNSNVGKNAFSFEKMTIKESLQIISDCDLYIGNDTGWAHISVALKVKALTIFCDSPVAAYGSYSSKMITVEPEGVLKGATTHDTLGKDKISFDEVYNKSIQMLN